REGVVKSHALRRGKLRAWRSLLTSSTASVIRVFNRTSYRLTPVAHRFGSDNVRPFAVDPLQAAEDCLRPLLQPKLSQARQDARDTQEVVVVWRQPVPSFPVEFLAAHHLGALSAQAVEGKHHIEGPQQPLAQLRAGTERGDGLLIEQGGRGNS